MLLINFPYFNFISAPALTTEPPAGPDSKQTTESQLAAYYTDMPCPFTVTQYPQRPTTQIQSTPRFTSTSNKPPKKKNRCSYCNCKVKLIGT